MNQKKRLTQGWKQKANFKRKTLRAWKFAPRFIIATNISKFIFLTTAVRFNFDNNIDLIILQ